MNYTMNFKEDHQSTLWNGQTLLIGDDLNVRGELVDLISGIGGRIVNPLPIEFNQSDLEDRINIATVIFQICRWDKITKESLLRVERLCAAKDLPLLILLQLNNLDSALCALDYSNIEFVITDEVKNLTAELLVTLNNIIAQTTSATFGIRDESNLVDLRKISADVDRIAQVLSQLSGEQISGRDRDHIQNPIAEPDTAPSVSDAAFSFKATSDSELLPYGNTQDKEEAAGVINAVQIRNLIKARRLREQYFDAELFADPAWDMLLDLMAARLEDTKVSVSSLCIAASVPPTTALRWIKTMTEVKIFERKADERDGRRIFIQLSDETVAGMVGFFSMLRNGGLMMI